MLGSVACGESSQDGGGSGGSGATTSDLGEPFDSYVEATCSMARTCCQKAGNSTAPLADCESEVARQRDFDELAQTGHVVAAEPQSTHCLAAYDELETSCVLTPSFETACTGAFQGTLAEGAACDSVEECALGATGVTCGSVGATARTCHTLPLVGEAAPCWTDTAQPRTNSNSTDGTLPGHCGAVLHCQLASSSLGACAVPSAAGGPCYASDDCADGFYCNNSLATPACQPAKHEGEACGTTSADAPCARPFKCRSGTCAAPSVATEKLCSGDYD
jgi:hypothetical protein